MNLFQERRAHKNWDGRAARAGFCAATGWPEFFGSLLRLILKSNLDTGDFVLNITPMN